MRNALRERQAASRWLVVLDNADDPATFAELLPEGPGDVIVTTRNHAWSRHSFALEVGVFPRAESLALLDRRGATLNAEEASELASRLGDLPAAIETAGYWLATTARPLGEFFELLDTHVDVALSGDHAAPVSATFAVALETLRAQSPAAAGLAELLAFFAPARIPTAILKTAAISRTLAVRDPSMRDPLLLSSLIQQIGRFGLVRSDPASGTVVMHVLTQLVIRGTIADDDRGRMREQVLSALAELNPGDADDAGNWHTYEMLRAHLDALRAAESADPAVRQLIIDEVRYLRLRNLSASAETLAGQAIGAWASGEDDVMTLLLRFQLANVLRDVGRMEQAYEIDRDLLERFTGLLGDEHAYTLMVAGSYAQDLRERGEWAKAREREEKTYELIPGVLGEDHPRTLMAANNYALTLRLAGRYEDAAVIDNQTYEKRRRLLGEHHPFTFSSADSYGMDQRDLGDLSGSRVTLEVLWRSCEEVLGEDHPNTMRAMRNLATTLRWLDDAPRAAELLDIALTRYERTLGRIHQHTLGCQVERANVASDQGRHAAARRTAELAVAGYGELFADEHHPFRLVVLNNLGVFVRRAGEPAQGREIAEKAAAHFGRVLGEDHTITALSLVNVANAAAAGDDFEEARRLDDRAYEVLRATLRPENIAVIGAAVNVAIGRLRTGDHDESDLNRALAWAAQTVGENHSIVRRGEQRQRIDLTIEPFVM
ncbi:MAG: FxSxx-COOH system tetratricopeptide repeat protein [Actinoplanes sp.]